MRSLASTVEWIAGDGRWPGAVFRLLLVTGGCVLLSIADDLRVGRPIVGPALSGLAVAMVLVVPFVLWRLIERRRRVQRRDAPPVRTLDLGQP